MAAPTNAAYVKKALANPEPSTHGPTLPTCAMHKVISYLMYCGRVSRAAAIAVFDPERTCHAATGCMTAAIQPEPGSVIYYSVLGFVARELDSH